MNIAHLADTHLGCIGTGWQRTIPDPFAPHLSIRQQEADIKTSFAEAIERILILKPDFVLHTGDLFDHAHPTPHTTQFAFKQLQKLSASDIPVVLLEGDHSAPRVPAQGEPLQILGNLPGIHVVCGERYQKLRVKNVLVYALPHRSLLSETEDWQLSNEDIFNTSDVQILAGHGVADGLPFYQTHRSAAAIKVREIASHFEYVALGHCHRFCQVLGTDRAFYSGSSAMALTSDFRPGISFGFNMVSLTKGHPPLVRRELVGTRCMREYGLSDAYNYSAGDIMQFLTRQIEAVPAEGAYCRVVIKDVNPAVRSQIVIREIERLFPLTEIAGLSVHIHIHIATSGTLNPGQGQTPRQRFLERLKQEEISETMRDLIQGLGTSLFDQADAQLRTEDQDAN